MTHRTLILGSRGSQLALRQSELVREALLSAHPDLLIEIKIIKTKGDKLQHLALDASGDKGLFTGELEASLRRGEIDLAVHSLKDLPVDPAEGTCLAAYLPRAVTHDTLIGPCPLESLPEGAVVGTSSKRRAYQIALLSTPTHRAHPRQCGDPYREGPLWTLRCHAPCRSRALSPRDG